MKLEIKDFPWPDAFVRLSKEANSTLIKCCMVNQWLTCFVCIEAGLWHASISHPKRYPTWDELKAIRYALMPNDKTMAILFPPMEQYVNIHQNCFHLHEVPELHEK